MFLIHGIGHRHQMWDPVIPILADHFDTVAIDLRASERAIPSATVTHPRRRDWLTGWSW